MRGWKAGAVAALSLCVALCAASVQAVRPGHGSAIVLPPTSGVFDYQLGGVADRVHDQGRWASVDVVVRDVTAWPLPGAYNVCYVNGFQTQPQDAAAWRRTPRLLLQGPDGVPLTDPSWPDEYVLDPGSPDRRRDILARVGPQIDECARRGFDAVELDNLDTYTRFEGLDRHGAFQLARAYIAWAHAQGLAVGQKNAAEIAATARRQLGFDFAVAEECAAYDECTAYTRAYGPHVLQVEYAESLADAGLTFRAACRTKGRAPLMVLRDVDLVGPAEPDYRRASCTNRG